MEAAHLTFLELVNARVSVRTFQQKPVERELLMQCVEAARLAPSAENAQPWRFLIIDDPEVKRRLARHAFSGIYRATKWAEQAPVLVVLFARLDIVANRLGKLITGIPYYLLDLGISGEHFVLQAQALGLGSCWIGWFSAKGVKKALNVPRSYRPVSIIAVGYPAHERKRIKQRKPINEISGFNEFEK
jgi:nitroreductase